ncbi:MAG: hypothetical protein WCO45_03805 [Pseudanabaena sp. ELA607]|jgi:hypothetical protein
MDFQDCKERLDKMEALLKDRREQKEFIIDYLIERFKRHVAKSNEYLEIEGEISYYDDIYKQLAGEFSKLNYLLADGKLDIGVDDDVNQPNSAPNGKGGTAHLVKVSQEDKMTRYDQKAEVLAKRAADLCKICQKYIDELKDKLSNTSP